MSSKTTKVMAIRVKNETAEYFKGKPLNKVVESVHNLAINNEVEIKGNGDVVIFSGNDECEDGVIPGR